MIEIRFLVYVTVFTALMWLPYILNVIAVRGLRDAVGYPENPKPMAPWAQRLKAAHYNAVENLVVFAALVLAAQVEGVSNAATILATSVYFWARLVHAVAYTFAIPWVRTLSFAAGLVCQLTLAWQIVA